MAKEVQVTRKGQTTIPIEFRMKYGIKEGSRLIVSDTEDGILFRKAPRTAELAGSGAKFATLDEMKRLLDRLRDEDI